jgi:hypothetical protein
MIAGALALAAVTTPLAAAQTSDEAWDVPINLSHSGAATNPTIFADSGSVLHAIWQDEFSNYVAAKLVGNEWSAPAATDLHLLFGLPGLEATADDGPPFTGLNPLFLADDRANIYAIWITTDGKLYASRAISRDFTRFGAWTRRRLISDSAASFAAKFDARGDLHLAFVRTTNGARNPAGLYYTRLTRFGSDWVAPALLYGSAYFRGLSGGETNVSLAASGTPEAPLVYIAWDNRPRKQVLLVKSTDGGATWEQPVRVAGPTAASGQANPYNIRVGALEDSLVLIWQNGPPGGACTQFYQSSGDAGATWSEPQLMLQDQAGCAQANEFVTGQAAAPGGLLYLLSQIKSQSFLSAWNGTQWSLPQEQGPLAGFDETETFTDVIFDCRQATWFADRLHVVGCDTGEGGDIWITSREVAAADWFAAPVWSQPVPVNSSSFEIGNLEMLATSDDFVHAFFSQPQDAAIYYLRWDGARWTRLTAVIQLTEGTASWPAIAVGPDDKLFLVTRSSGGSLYFSRSTSTNALTASGWAAAARLPITQDGKVTPADVVWDAAGIITIAYAVPVNEQRGVYLVQSKDEGRTWSQPVQVFDGAAADFELVGAPSLAVANDGSLHVLWNQQSISAEGAAQTLALYYAQSAGSNPSFADAELVIEAPVTWRDMVVDGRGQLHRLWQQSDAKATLWDQVSQTGGQTWQTPQRLAVEEGVADVIADNAGQLQLVSAGVRSLSHWLWNGTRWQAQAPLRWLLAAQRDAPVSFVSAAVSSDGALVVGLALPTGANDANQVLLAYATRALGQPVAHTVVQPDDNPLLRGSIGPSSASPTEQGLAASAMAGKPFMAPDVGQDLNQVADARSQKYQGAWIFLGIPLPILALLARRVLRGRGRS